ncbi:serine hydrolase (FSH1) [Achlya hypogyna]|uniref:Serine hydrolase (FSH1) n=1 Tax=Achlya hypogyna TaxID=1202772 RepID=A0A1V9ZMG5_ACHHY|nr:serine hydrolase (FSH1) [Achlya hypogyna]
MKLRVLCLHGHRQSAKKLKGKMAALCRAVKATTEFVFIDGPFEVPYEPTSAEHMQKVEEMTEAELEELKLSMEQFAWWNFEQVPGTAEYKYSGVDEAVAYVRNIVATQGPFHGVFGFSQGGMFAAHLLTLDDPAHLSFAFGIFCAAAPMKDPSFAIVPSAPLLLPSLHIMGAQDELVTETRSRALAGHFAVPELIVHNGGHYIPTQKDPRTAWKVFLEAQATQLLR